MLESFILANTNHFLKSKWTFQINCKIYFSEKNIKKNRKKKPKKNETKKKIIIIIIKKFEAKIEKKIR